MNLKFKSICVMVVGEKRKEEKSQRLAEIRV